MGAGRGISAVREYLDTISSHSVSTLPPSVLMREDAELRRLLRIVLDVVADYEGTQLEKNSGFTGDLFNVGSGALESGANAQIDSYFSGSAVITLASDTTLHVYAFGYDSDRGAGSYTLDDLSVTATRINAGS